MSAALFQLCDSSGEVKNVHLLLLLSEPEFGNHTPKGPFRLKTLSRGHPRESALIHGDTARLIERVKPLTAVKRVVWLRGPIEVEVEGPVRL